MDNSKLILISGGKGSGKSNLVSHLKCHLAIDTAECKEKLHELVIELFDVPREEYFRIYNNRLEKELPNKHFKMNRFEAEKVASAYTGFDSIMVLDQNWADYENSVRDIGDDIVQPEPQFAYVSIRAAMIYVSEFVAKPLFGQDYFGVTRANKVASKTGIYVDDSVFGTMDEVNPAIDLLGEENIMLIKITGRGTYEGDSRRMLETEKLSNQVWLENPYDDMTHQYVHEGVQKILEFVGDTK